MTFWTEVDVAFETGLSVSTLQKMRCRGRGPTYLKLGASVRYRPEDVRAWIKAGERKAAAA